LYDPHSPYDPPEPFRSQYRGRQYDGEVAYVDSQLGRLFRRLKQTSRYDNSLIVLLSDHGESLGEHGEKEHGFFLYRSTTHVPLIVKLPAGKRVSENDKRITRPVETIAVAPTIVELLAVKDPIQEQFQTGSLFAQQPGRLTAYAETFYPFSSFGWSPLHSVETGRFKYVEAPQPELYDLSADPAEQTNIASQQPAMLAELQAELKRRLALAGKFEATAQGSQLSPETTEKLRSLGYFAYKTPVSAEALAKGLPDPKVKLENFNAILEAGDAFHSGDFARGEALSAKVQQQEPQLYLIPFMLGEAKAKQQDWPAAQAQFERALSLNPSFDQAMTALARALRLQNKNAGARELLEKALQENPNNFRAWYELGRTEAVVNPSAAVAAFEKTIAIQPNFSFARRDLGMLHFQQKNYQAAAKQLREASRLGISDPELWNFLGICYSRMNQLSAAVQSYKRALALNPELAEAHLNLAFAYERLKKAPAAAKEYQAACRLESRLCRSAGAN